MVEERRVRRIAVMFGSRSDLGQCLEGLELLQRAVCHEIELIDIRASSIHRMTRETLAQLESLSKTKPPIDVLITAAGWANHLTGVSDAYLRYGLGDTQIVVVGVALVDPDNPRHSMAARLSITEVPGTQVVYKDEEGEFVGADGFKRACGFAIRGSLPEITPPKPRPVEVLLLDEAVVLARNAVAV